ncbi:MAG: DUF4422 domain-containing protein [Desulfovibrio sp.]|nr:DUF4422 domain-containing protein [Desulfovibrio sp.]
MKYVFLGENELTGECLAKAGRENVVAFVSTDREKWGSEAAAGMRWQALLEIDRESYDYLIVFHEFDSVEDTQRFHRGLQQVGMPMEKFVFAGHFLRSVRTDMFCSIEGEKVLAGLLARLGVQSLLDYDMYFESCEHVTRYGDPLRPLYGMRLIGRKQAAASCRCALRESLYDGMQGEHSGRYAAVLLAAERGERELSALIGDLRTQARYFVCQIRAGSVQDVPAELRGLLSEQSRLAFQPAPSWSWLVVDTWANKSATLYVAAHKPFSMQTQAEIYRPIQGGSSLHEPLGFCRDDEGENISEMNPYLNELTSLYWIWKHDRSELVGLVHYRRYFLNDLSGTGQGNLLDRPHILGYLTNYDILLASLFANVYLPVKGWIRRDVGKEVFAEASAVLEDIIRERQPDYLETYFDVMEGKSMYRFHMFVTHRWILESYCEWLFSFLPEAVRRLRPERFEGFTRQRVLGFFGERLLTVWLLHQNLRIMELPVVEVRNG